MKTKTRLRLVCAFRAKVRQRHVTGLGDAVEVRGELLVHLAVQWTVGGRDALQRKVCTLGLLGFMVYGLWFMVYGLWFMVYGLWFMV